VKDLRGNPGKRGVNENEPKPPVGDPEMPPGLSEAAQCEWFRMLECHRSMGLIKPVDATALAVYCATFDIWLKAMADVNENGLQIKQPVMGRKGTIEENVVVGVITKKNPAVAIAFEAKKTLKSYACEFGDTPAARSKLHVESEKPPDPADAYFNKKQNAPKHIN
jgi:P27 family predicted phage terminase small subunit